MTNNTVVEILTLTQVFGLPCMLFTTVNAAADVLPSFYAASPTEAVLETALRILLGPEVDTFEVHEWTGSE